MSRPTVMRTDLPGAIERKEGKVRDIYDYGDGLLIVASDRISAFDVNMTQGIPNKGRVLTGISEFWFRKTAAEGLCDNHLISTDVGDFPSAVQPFAEMLDGRSMWCRKARVVPVECVVRGYITGSGWKSYLNDGTVCGIKLPEGLQQCQQLPEAIFTPTTKAESGHDKPISFDEMRGQIGDELAEEMRLRSLALYNYAARISAICGILLADTKFEFGVIDGRLIAIDELLTPDSSRYWDSRTYEVGRDQDSFDKQFLRNYLETLDWNKEPPPPVLPGEIITGVQSRYEECYYLVTGEALAA